MKITILSLVALGLVAARPTIVRAGDCDLTERLEAHHTELLEKKNRTETRGKAYCAIQKQIVELENEVVTKGNRRCSAFSPSFIVDGDRDELKHWCHKGREGAYFE